MTHADECACRAQNYADRLAALDPRLARTTEGHARRAKEAARLVDHAKTHDDSMAALVYLDNAREAEALLRRTYAEARLNRLRLSA